MREASSSVPIRADSPRVRARARLRLSAPSRAGTCSGASSVIAGVRICSCRRAACSTRPRTPRPPARRGRSRSGMTNSKQVRAAGGYVVPPVAGCRGPPGCTSAHLGAPARETVKLRATEKESVAHTRRSPLRVKPPRVARGCRNQLACQASFRLHPHQRANSTSPNMIESAHEGVERAWSTTATARARAWGTPCLSVARDMTISRAGGTT